MNIKTNKIAVIGSGSWATAISKMLLENVTQINWFFRKKDTVEQFEKVKHNPRYLRSVEFDTSRINFYNDINQIIEESDILVFAIPSAFLPTILENLKIDLSHKYILSGIKGIVSEENLLVVEYLNKFFNVPFEMMGVLAGPCHAEEVALEKLSYLTVASLDEIRASKFAELIKSDYIFTSVSDDIWGTEYNSVIKNIIAIAAGITHGLRYGDNFHAVLLSNAIQEIKRFVDTVHPITRDIKSSAYLGDLLVTGYSQFSRNRQFGTMIGKGYSVKTAQLDMNMIAEGYFAARSIYEINKNYKVDMPISEAVYKILYEGVSPKKEIAQLTEKLS
ncbi:MAG: NAD(P)H-dependent glycerol-3-phosphate dehydrogenase [Prolixibacteraceae bacterium]|mgnify:CR=1 FL=1|jgi:glycerol-3-phosphate dehydrogenase (NAD(P)+)|nr:NAD(P)H-dependent glycerol-3-phosphate dehydrogenase [Prolixibacteraceae bacterium]MBT6005650.1 NAD(P)H-dependent glycerol-3-phosphate dehydrogenase [Prolixibacteraceae bacterium]MBT6766491.1 NAD(P)H-dependent glycerol-3-phosphate dehydrogenase [Prolixibacteraceae bacterium]MBT7000212.1 NAD(P)H-dependent glycerol-3-phosphate dehydrogenase [Prolixibacteraceae bacterium]MBT7393817.1 NAD(P)H-dependent glycerol-3-phosphate dehydrogenase [Prolixibacteraceae bacterium]